MKSLFKRIFEERRQPLEVEAYEFLSNNGLKLPQYYFIQSLNQANELILTLDSEQKYALKVMSPRILHKSDFNAVHLNVNLDEMVDKFVELQGEFNDLDFRGILVVPMASSGIELLVGSMTDPTFGVITVFGVGGTLVEIIKDVTFGKAPISFDDARLMIHSIKSQELLKGPRGMPVLHEIEMANLLVKISQISFDFRDIIKEIDLNPVRITSRGIIPLDARIIFHPEKC